MSAIGTGNIKKYLSVHLDHAKLDQYGDNVRVRTTSCLSSQPIAIINFPLYISTIYVCRQVQRKGRGIYFPFHLTTWIKRNRYMVYNNNNRIHNHNRINHSQVAFPIYRSAVGDRQKSIRNRFAESCVWHFQIDALQIINENNLKSRRDEGARKKARDSLEYCVRSPLSWHIHIMRRYRIYIYIFMYVYSTRRFVYTWHMPAHFPQGVYGFFPGVYTQI